MDDSQFRQLIDTLRFSWRGYRKVRKGVKKRLDRHRAERGIHTFDAYLAQIQSDPAIRSEVEILMTVSVSRFFRDGTLWKTLEKEILPELIQGAHDPVSAWCAGIALGQEVYSLKILWHSMTSPGIILPELRITATDSNPDYLARAKEGIFEGNVLKGIPEDQRNRHFHTSDGKHYDIAGCLKDDIRWMVHDMVRHPPPGQSFQIIFLRNSLLTYYGEDQRESTMMKIVDSLDDRGFLIIGTHEKIPPSTAHLTPLKNYAFIFRCARDQRI